MRAPALVLPSSSSQLCLPLRLLPPQEQHAEQRSPFFDVPAPPTAPLGEPQQTGSRPSSGLGHAGSVGRAPPAVAAAAAAAAVARVGSAGGYGRSGLPPLHLSRRAPSMEHPELMSPSGKPWMVSVGFRGPFVTGLATGRLC